MNTEQTEMSMEPELISERAAAQKIGVCVRTIRREVERGHFPKPVRVGRCVRYVASEVLAYLNGLKEQRA